MMLMIGSENFMITQKQLDDDKIANRELAVEWLPLARQFQFAFISIRILLVLVSFFYKPVTKVFLYFEALQQVINVITPCEIELSARLLVDALINLFQFLMNYFHWWPALICSNIALSMTILQRAIFLDDDLNVLILTYICFLIWHSFNLLICHLLVTKVGMIFTEAEVLRTCKADLLDNLDQGLILLDEEDSSILYSNKVFNNLKIGILDSYTND
jgi:hypothetical protein